MKNKTILLLIYNIFLCTNIFNAQVSVGIGNYTSPTEAYPLNANYSYSFAQTIYYASEIGTSGSITAISFEMSNINAIPNSDDHIDIWIGHTTQTVFSSTSDWTNVSTLTQVMANGSLTKNGTTITFTFDTPFDYNGVDNLIIAMDANEQGYDTENDVLIGSQGSTNRTLYYRNDNFNPIPETLPEGTLTSTYGNITFYGIMQNCIAPNALSAENITITSADIKWVENGTATAWQIEWGEAGFEQGQGTLVSVSDNPTYELSGLSNATVYAFFVRADCGSESSVWVGPQLFTTFAVNNTAAGAISVSCGETVIDDTSKPGVTVDYQGNCGSVINDAPNLWYIFRGEGVAQDVTLSFCSDTTYDTSVGVFVGTPDDLTCYASNDDFCDVQSEVTFVSDGVQDYYIMVEGYQYESTGQFTMEVTCEEAGTPSVANQDCSTAQTIIVGDTAIVSDNTNASNNINNPSCDPFGTISDVWFSFVAPASGEVDIVTSLITATDINLAFYTGSCGSLFVADCSNVENEADFLSIFGLLPDETYYVQAWNGGAGEEGSFTIEITDPTLVGTNQASIKGLSIYPNPVSDILHIITDATIDRIKIYNNAGSEVLSTKTSEIDMSHLTSGIYFVKIKMGTQIYAYRVVKW